MEKCQDLAILYKLEILKELELLTSNADAYTIAQIKALSEATLKHLDDFTPSQMLDYIITLRTINGRLKK